MLSQDCLKSYHEFKMDSKILWEILKFTNFEYYPASCAILKNTWKSCAYFRIYFKNKTNIEHQSKTNPEVINLMSMSCFVKINWNTLNSKRKYTLWGFANKYSKSRSCKTHDRVCCELLFGFSSSLCLSNRILSISFGVGCTWRNRFGSIKRQQFFPINLQFMMIFDEILVYQNEIQ